MWVQMLKNPTKRRWKNIEGRLRTLKLQNGQLRVRVHSLRQALIRIQLDAQSTLHHDGSRIIRNQHTLRLAEFGLDEIIAPPIQPPSTLET